MKLSPERNCSCLREQMSIILENPNDSELDIHAMFNLFTVPMADNLEHPIESMPNTQLSDQFL